MSEKCVVCNKTVRQNQLTTQTSLPAT